MALENDVVDLSTLILGVVSEFIIDGSCNQDRNLVCLSFFFKLRCHVNMLGQVADINLLIASQRTLNSPALVQTEAKLDFVVRHPLIQARMLGVLPHVSRPFQRCNNLEERN